MLTTLPTEAATSAGIFDRQPARAVASRALHRLAQHPHFRGRGRTIHVTFDSGTLILSGRLSSFYLKQLLDEALQEVEGVQRIENHVDVVCSDGISGVRD